jgi:hypothetical protein
MKPHQETLKGLILRAISGCDVNNRSANSIGLSLTDRRGIHSPPPWAPSASPPSPQASSHIFFMTSRSPEATRGLLPLITRVVPIRLIGVRCVEVHEVLFSTVREGPMIFSARSPCGSRKSHAIALRDIPLHQCLKERRLSRPGPTDDVNVAEAVRLLDARRDPPVSERGPAQVGGVVR